MFRAEAQAVLGTNYPQRGRSGSTGTMGQPRPGVPGGPAESAGVDSTTTADGIPEMGILKGLSSMGDQVGAGAGRGCICITSDRYLTGLTGIDNPLTAAYIPLYPLPWHD